MERYNNLQLTNNYVTPAFGAMKKSQFKGLDLLCVNTFKAPIEKFNTNLDLQNWAGKQLTSDMFSGNLQARSALSTQERNSVFRNWMEYLNNAKDVTKSAALVMMKSVFGDLKPKTDEVPPHLNGKVLNKTLGELESKIEAKQAFNFKKQYVNNLQSQLLKKGESLESGWLNIPSQKNDPKNFAQNVEKVKMFSNDAWCTKALKSEQYLKDGNFHILYDNHRPVAAIRTNGNTILEIQGERNNSEIPMKYFDKIVEYVNKEGLDKSIVKDAINYGYEKAECLDEYAQICAKAIQDNDGAAFLKKFGMYLEDDGKGGQKLNKLRNLSYGITMGDLGIDENKAFANLVKIEDDAIFTNSRATKLPRLEVIDGSADFRGSMVNNISALKEVHGNVDIRSSKLTPEDFKNVKITGKLITGKE